MKKVNLLCLAALATLTLTNCSQDELSSPITAQSQNAIGFDSYFGRNAQGVSSRGSVQTIASVATSGFGVYAYQSTESYTSGSGEFNPNLMSNVQVTGSGSGTYTWTYSPTRYWPVSDYVSFLAYAPYSQSYKLVGTGGQESGDRIYLSGFEVNSTITSQVDLLWNKTSNLNKQKPSNDEKVHMTFAHALSRIGLSVSSSQADANTTITISSITLSGKDKDTETTKTGAFSKSGLLKLTETTASTDLWASISTENKLAFTYESSNLSATALNNSTTTITNNNDSYLMVIPQDFSYETSGTPSLYLTVTYTVKTGNTESDATVTNVVSAPVNQKFEAGKAYTLKINLGLKAIEFDVTSVEDWGTASDVSVTI